MSRFQNADGEQILRAMIAASLSEIDGAIGDGDHGVNMKKGFTLCAERLDAEPGGFTEGLKILGRVLMAEIGGSMGPLYGSFFTAMARAGKESTRDLVAKVGRSARLGERSRGAFDAGAASMRSILN